MRFALSFLAVALLSGCGHSNPGAITTAGADKNFAIEMAAKQREQEWAQRKALFLRERELIWGPADTPVQSYPQFAEFNDVVDRWHDRGESPTHAISGGGFPFGSEMSFAGVELNGAHAWQRSVAATELTK
jgi:hypothetical protein